MKYYIIAGESSGDLHGSNLMKELKKVDDNVDFRCWGGDLMKAQGCTLVKHYKDLAFMGFLEVLLNIKTILKNIKFCKQDILDYNPDVVIFIDYPGFNLRIAEFVHKQNIKVFYYISPQIWAWKQSRIKKIKRYVDRMFVILPFEKKFYEKYNYHVDFVGHPLLDAINSENSDVDKNIDFIKENNLECKPIIALLPGSRKQEITKILTIMTDVVEHYNDYQFVIAGVPTFSEDFYKSFSKNDNVKIVFNKTYELLQNSYAALITSGTATLEAALLDVPEVVCYKTSFISYFIAKKFIGHRIRFISIANLVMDREVIKELIQKDLTVKNIIFHFDKILNETEKRKQMFSDFKQLKEKLGGSGASKKTAELMYGYLKG
ncbi:MAG: lipid-A-disaccharide synthase [Bacteroidales bacterium]|nr:lipid-A-disaccharide synthase [Bacteroidales bacterium]